MKKATTLFTLFLLFIQLQSKGQSSSYSVKLGEVQSEPKRLATVEIIGEDETGFYTVKKGDGIAKPDVLEFCSKDLKIVKSVAIRTKDKELKRIFRFATFLKDKLYIISSHDISDSGKVNLYSQEVDKKTLEMLGKPKKIVSLKREQYPRKYSIRTSYEHKLSKDGSKLLLGCKHSYAKQKIRTVREFIIFDADLSLIKHTSSELENNAYLMSAHSYEMSNSGDIYVWGAVAQNGEFGGTPKMLSCAFDQQKFTLHKPSKEEGFVRVMVKLDDEENATFCGLSYEQGNVKGFYCLKINGKSQETIHEVSSRFGGSFTKDHLSMRETKISRDFLSEKGVVGLVNYDVKDFIELSDGGMLAVTEQNHARSFNERYGDILVLRTSKDGTLLWSEKLSKFQIDYVENFLNFSSMFSFSKGEKLYLMYNNHPENFKNKDLEKTKIMALNSKGITTIAVIDGEGITKKEILFDFKTFGVFPAVVKSKQISDSEWIMCGKKHGKHRYAIVSIND